MKTAILVAASAAATLSLAGGAASQGPIYPGVYTPGAAQLQPIATRAHT